MTHIETLIMNTIRESLERLQRTGVGYIDVEESYAISYVIDDKQIVVKVMNGG